MRFSLGLLIALLTGCSFGPGEGSFIQASRVPQSLNRYRTVYVDVSTRAAELYEGVEPLKLSLISRLAALSCFSTFVSVAESSRADLKITAVITGASAVSSAERTLYGGLAGRPRVQVDVELTDARTGMSIGRFQAEGTTTGGSPTGYTAPEAYENAGIGIADYLHLHH